MTGLKRLAAPKWWPIKRKVKKFVVSPRGSHPNGLSLPLLVLIRDVLKLAETNKEAKRVIKAGEVFIDGKKRKDQKFGVGLFDSIEIPSLKKAWRAVPKDGLSFIEIPAKEAKLKICKIVNKKTLKGNKNQLNLSDGRNLLTDKKYSTYDSLVIQLPDQKVIDHIKFEVGCLVLVTGGKSAGKMAKIKSIERERVWLENEKPFEIPRRMVIAVGTDKPAIKLE